MSPSPMVSSISVFVIYIKDYGLYKCNCDSVANVLVSIDSWMSLLLVHNYTLMDIL